jgi:hypothetical protein
VPLLAVGRSGRPQVWARGGSTLPCDGLMPKSQNLCFFNGLLACLNAPIVKRQIRSKQFTQDIIDTIGRRLMEIALPVPRDEPTRRRIAEETRGIIETRSRLRNRATQIALEVEGKEEIDEEDLDDIL